MSEDRHPFSCYYCGAPADALGELVDHFESVHQPDVWNGTVRVQTSVGKKDAA